MSGLENMKRQILDEANHAAQEKISEAKEKAEEILREAKKEMESQSVALLQKSEAETKAYAQRLESSSEMQRKQALLQAKQDDTRRSGSGISAGAASGARALFRDASEDAGSVCAAAEGGDLFFFSRSAAYAAELSGCDRSDSTEKGRSS